MQKEVTISGNRNLLLSHRISNINRTVWEIMQTFPRNIAQFFHISSILESRNLIPLEV